MPEKHPYVTSRKGLILTCAHLRRSFPAKFTAQTLKKLGYAPNNETYIINSLRFLGLIDDDGARTKPAAEVFAHHKDEEFQQAFGKVVENAYGDLFTLHRDAAWDLAVESLITYFRQSDQSSDTVGRRQAATFQTLAALAGHGEVQEIPKTKPAPAGTKKVSAKKAAGKKDRGVGNKKPPGDGSKSKGTDLGLTVRIEINLPAEGDQATYDRIFKSIRENLLNG